MPICAELRVGDKTHAGHITKRDGKATITFGEVPGLPVSAHFQQNRFNLRHEDAEPVYFLGNSYRDNAVANRLDSFINEANQTLMSRSCGFGMLAGPRSNTHAWLIVVCETGPGLHLGQGEPKVIQAHIVRQLVEVQP